MLALSREAGQSVILTFGEIRIAVKVVGVKSGQVRLSFDAPQEVKILRDEICLESARCEPTEGG